VSLPGVSLLGDEFDVSAVHICQCGFSDPNRCRLSKSSDWLVGPNCPGLVVESMYSFFHLNLSRKIPDFDQFLGVVGKYFRDADVPFRPLSGVSGTSVALLCSSRGEQKLIHKLLRSPEIKLELGIRIYRICDQLVPDRPGDVV
jgi:hypothetical protein